MPSLNTSDKVKNLGKDLLRFLVDAAPNANDVTQQKGAQKNAQSSATKLAFRWNLKNRNIPKLIVQTTLEDLLKLLKSKLPSPYCRTSKEDIRKTSKGDIRNVLRVFEEYLKILDDNRLRTQGTPIQHFTLRLWYKKTDEKESIERNLEQFEKLWEEKKQRTSPVKSSSVKRIQDWSQAPDIPVFYGRTRELKKLKRWIDKCRLVAILGMGGIGKTALSIKLAREVQDKFEFVYWRSLLDAPPATEVLRDLIWFLSHQQETDLRNTIEFQVQLLVEYLRKHRCLLILDNADAIIQSGHHGEKYLSGYGKLLEQVGEVPHQSCLLITSRVKPQNLERSEGEAKAVRFLELGGLDYPEGKEIFKAISSEFSGSEDQWQKLIQFYNGNPLALELAAHHIKATYSGEISKVFEVGHLVFDNLRHELLDWHFKQLSDEEKEIMYWLSINREPVSISELKEDILSPEASNRVSDTLQSLQGQLPIEKRDTGKKFTLQPVLIEYMTEQLIYQVCQEIENQKFDIFNKYALIKAIAKDYVRQAETRLILKPVEDRISNLEEKLKNSLTLLKTQSEFPSGYAAGNIINLFSHRNTDLTGYDFSNLTIRQAYLQGVNLQNVNFANSQLTKCNFTKTLASVHAVALSRDGKLLAAGDANCNLYLWRVEDGQQLWSCEENGRVWSIAFNNDGKTLVTLSEEYETKQWDVNTGECLQTFQGSDTPILGISCIGSDDDPINNEHAGTIKLRESDDPYIFLKRSFKDSKGTFKRRTLSLDDLKKDETTLGGLSPGRCLPVFWDRKCGIWTVAFSPDGQVIASGGNDHTVKLWQVESGICIETLEGHTKRVRAVTFSNDGKFLASGSEDCTIQIWDADKKRCLKILAEHTSRVHFVTFIPSQDEQLLASASDDRTIKLWDFKTGKCLKTFQGYTNQVWSVAFCPEPNSDILASGNGDHSVRLWDFKTGECKKTLQGHTNWIWSVAFSPDGKTLATGSDDHTVKLWNVQNGKLIKTLDKTLGGHTSRVHSVAFSPDGKTLATGSDDKTIKLWYIWDFNNIYLLADLKGHTQRVRAVTFSNDGKLLASSSEDRTIIIWDVQTGKHLKIIEGHKHYVCTVAFNPSRDKASILASGSDDHTIKLWNVLTGECLKTFKRHKSAVRSVAFSRDGKFIASGGFDKTVKLLYSKTGRLKKLNSPEERTSRIRSVASCHNGQHLASGSEDGTIKIWDLKTGKCLKVLKAEGPYQGMNITKVKGLTDAQKETLKVLGAETDN